MTSLGPCLQDRVVVDLELISGTLDMRQENAPDGTSVTSFTHLFPI